MKHTLLSLLVAGLFAGLGTSAMAQNVTADDQPKADAANAQAADPAADAPSAAQKNQEYQAALKKCETLDGDDKTTCRDEAKKKFGQM
jgi:membrane protease subunit (stomatin/prohibitin family)